MGLLKTFRDKFGPGFLFAAAAVGTSHLVQSTRAGAEYGFSLAGLILFACLVKYPAFRFGPEYAAATGKTLIDNYAQQGPWVMMLYAVTLPVDAFIATAAVGLVSAGISKHVFGIGISNVAMTSIIIGACALFLIHGKYRRFENLTKIFVVFFSVLVLVASVLALPELNWEAGSLGAPLTLNRHDSLFYIALAGWMPTAITASVFQSIWVCEKSKTLHRPMTMKEARFDFNVGYFSSLLLALCFVLMGTALLFKSNIPVASDASGFAAQLINIFTRVVGSWAYIIIATATLFVMVSTVLTLMDSCPRAMATVTNHLRASGSNEAVQVQPGQYLLFLILQGTGAILFLLLFLGAFKVFIDLAASIAFLTAPVIAWFNHRAIFHTDIPAGLQPARYMQLWSLVGIGVLTGFALWFLWLKL